VQRETILQNQIRLAISQHLPHITLWRNETGSLKAPNGRMVHFGLCPGSADLIGIIRPQGQFLALEVKLPGQYPRRDQKHFLEHVRSMGGVAHVVTSVQQTLSLLS